MSDVRHVLSAEWDHSDVRCPMSDVRSPSRRLGEHMRNRQFVKVTIWVIVIAMVLTLLSAALSSFL